MGREETHYKNDIAGQLRYINGGCVCRPHSFCVIEHSPNAISGLCERSARPNYYVRKRDATGMIHSGNVAEEMPPSIRSLVRKVLITEGGR